MNDLVRQHENACAQALDPMRSFIVQAPAGSGKTELLTQRYLKLLSRIHKGPEEIIAVTFTRKAAAQMRSRIVNALMDAKTRLEAPDAPHARLTWNLAQTALKHCEKNEWDIIAYPNRLRILTIDALCSHLASRMPILSNFGAAPQVVTDPQSLYQKAVHSLMRYLKENPSEQGALKTILKQLDNRLEVAHELMITMLQKRDQWLPHIGRLQTHHNVIGVLEEGLQRIIINSLERSYAACSIMNTGSLFSVIRNCAQNLLMTNPEHPLCLLEDYTDLPEPVLENLSVWQGISALFLTQEGEFRKSFTLNQGFLAPSKATNAKERDLRKMYKEAMEGFIAYLSDFEDVKLALSALNHLPPSMLCDEQAEMICALIKLLPLLTAHLTLQFKDTGEVDFIEVALRAVSALGDPEEPTELALSLDYQLQHLLIDEFQDTSFAQFALFEKLVAGWSPGEGRTLFLVGDPMQSIYRFRGAEVGLFLHVQQFGLNQIKLESLKLSRNFRSHFNVVEWVNACFKDIFPKIEDKNLGAIVYSPAVSNMPMPQESEQSVYFYSDEKENTGKITQLILELLHSKDNSEHSIAILVRAKHHLNDILPALRKLHIPFEAHDIEKLGCKQSILDLLSLTQALLDLTDKIAWLAILRAPWCGLSLQDLYVIASDKQQSILWAVLLNYEILALSIDAKQRLKRIIPILEYWLYHRQKHQLAPWIKGAWLALGGPACYPNTPILSQSKVFFECLDKASEGGDVMSMALFEETFSTLLSTGYSALDNEMNPFNTGTVVQLMTIHKAKGLEFDVVIIPALEKKTRPTEAELLIWYERKHEQGVDLIIAPRKAHYQMVDNLYQHVTHELARKTELENARLLYVGLTRAKKEIHLFGRVTEKAPSKGSFLSYLWPKVLESQVDSSLKNDNITDVQEPDPAKGVMLKRLPATWHLPVHLDKMIDLDILDKTDSKTNLNRPNNTYNIDKLIGTFVHRILQLIAELGLAYWDTLELANCIPAWEIGLTRLGVRPNDKHLALNTVMRAVRKTLSDSIGRRILGNDHIEAHNEWALHYKSAQGMKQIIIDRTFIDKKGIRWIIDYKLAEELSNDHRMQVLHYAKIVSQLERRELKFIRCALYFPLKPSPQCWQEISIGKMSE